MNSAPSTVTVKKSAAKFKRDPRKRQLKTATTWILLKGAEDSVWTKCE